jgi:hypothetical protein
MHDVAQCACSGGKHPQNTESDLAAVCWRCEKTLLTFFGLTIDRSCVDILAVLGEALELGDRASRSFSSAPNSCVGNMDTVVYPYLSAKGFMDNSSRRYSLV